MVICRSRTDVEAETSSTVSDLRWIAALTFLWILVVIAPTTYLLVAGIDDRVQRQRHEATAEKMQKIQEVLRSRDAVIFGLAKLAESRDSDTGHHLERIAMYSTLLATEMRRHAPFQEQISSTFVHLIGITSALHDIGKVGVPDHILLKPGPLTDEEHQVMQRHARLGGECLLEIERRLGTSSFLQMAREIAFTHHERWNGQGYPNGLAHTEIPLAGRIVAIADVYDALSSPRVYKPPIPHDRCVQIIREESGELFDPHIVDIWMMIEPKFSAIARRFHGAVDGTTTVSNVVENAASSEAFEEAPVTG